MRAWAQLLPLLWLVACGAPDPGEPPPPARPPDVVLIVIDTLRADHVGAYGYDRPTTPTLDAVAAQGVLFTRALSTSSWTKPAIGSLFTSLHPSEHGAHTFDRHLSSRPATLAGLFRDAGYTTVGVSGNFVHVNAYTGMDRGFDTWESLHVPVETESETLWSITADDGRVHRFRAARAEEVNRAVLAHLPPDGDRPLFLYVHYMEPHSDYAPPDELRRRFVRAESRRFGDGPVRSKLLTDLAAGRDRLSEAERRHAIDLYDAEVAAADAGVAALLRALARRGVEAPVLAITSDHGEAFGEHASWFHGIDLHRATLAVPLIVRDPRRDDAGRRHPGPVSLLDVAPTLLALAGIPRPATLRGRALLEDEAVGSERTLVAELHPDAHFAEHAPRREQRLAVQRGPWKLIVRRDGTLRAWHLGRDPLEQTDGSGDAPGALVDEARRRLAALERSAEASKPTALEAEQRERLRALGYLGDGP
ncbi:MAG: sulfatase [Myxococcota bacterium]